MKKKVMAFLIAGLMVGCSVSSVYAQEAEEGAGKEITISMWKWIPVEGVQMDAIMEAWNEEHPEIHLDVVNAGSSEDVFQKYSSALPAGEGPTIMGMQVGSRANQFKDFCEPLAAYAEDKWGENWEDLFLDTALEQCRWSGDDYTVLPGGMTAAPVIEYNVNAFEKLGFTEPPKTMDELYEIIEKTKEDGQMIPGIGLGAKDGYTCRDIFMGIVNQMAPGKIYEAINGEKSFTDEEFVEAMNIWKEMWDKGLFADGSLGTSLYPDLNDNFMKAGIDNANYYTMISCGTWHGSSMTKKQIEDFAEQGACDPEIRLGAFPLPPVKEGCESNMVATVDVAWAINKDATEEEKTAAFEFIAWMTAGKGQEVFSNTLQVLPAAKDISIEAGLEDLNGETEKAAVEMFQSYVESNVGAREIPYPDIANALNDALQGVASGVMTSEEALQTVQTASENVSR